MSSLMYALAGIDVLLAVYRVVRLSKNAEAGPQFRWLRDANPTGLNL